MRMDLNEREQLVAKALEPVKPVDISAIIMGAALMVNNKVTSTTQSKRQNENVKPKVPGIYKYTCVNK